MSLARCLPRFRKAVRALAEIEAREHWSATQMADWQLERLNELWTHAMSAVARYRDLATTHNLPPRFDSLDHYRALMPLLEKSAVRASPESFLARGAARGQWRTTSGSTGVPMRFFASATTHQAALCYQYRFRQMWGLDIFGRAAFFGAAVPRTLGGIRGFSQRSRQSITDRLRNRIRLPIHQMSRDDLARQLDRIARFRPNYIYGYSRAIYLLALEAIERRFACHSLRVVMMTSEPAFDHMLAKVEQAFRVPATIEYGSTECGVIAHTWPDRKARLRSDRVIVETIARPDAAGHEIIVTVLDNPDFPLLRYRIGDFTDAPLGAANEAFPILHNIAGRNDDVLYAGDGAAVHPAEIDAIFEYARSSAVRRYKVHQQADGRINVQLEPADERPDVEKMMSAIGKLMPGREVNVELVAEIAQTSAGKHRLITSDYDPAAAPRQGLASHSLSTSSAGLFSGV